EEGAALGMGASLWGCVGGRGGLGGRGGFYEGDLGKKGGGAISYALCPGDGYLGEVWREAVEVVALGDPAGLFKRGKHSEDLGLGPFAIFEDAAQLFQGAG